MNGPASYIIRIYRFEPNNPRNIVGLVQEVGEKERRAFNTYDELWEILNSTMKNSPLERSLKPFLSDNDGWDR
jgi:hypothetical protein